MRALVLGGAACVWDDLARAQRLGDFDAVAAVNDVGAEYPGELAVWATLHPEKMARWVEKRKENGFPPAKVIAAHKGNTKERNGETPPPVNYVTKYMWEGMGGSGSSGLFVCKVLIEKGYPRIVLCGVPMQAVAAHFFDAQPWSECESFWQDWQAARPHIEKPVRSMSGRTRDLLGEPTKEWLRGVD